MDNKRSLDWVQALRGVAALAVVLCHGRYFYKGTQAWPQAERWMLPGAIGVDLFFMLSGFIMVYSTVKSKPTWRYVSEFLIKRFARIWPVYAIITVAWVIVAGRGFSYFFSTDKLFGLIKSVFFLPVNPDDILYFGASLPVGWSLNFEIYFYLVFAMCLFFGTRRWIALFGWMFGTLVLLPAVFGQLSFDVWRHYHFPVLYLDLVANPIIAEFLVGVLIGLLYQNKKLRFPNAQIAYCLVGISIVFAAVYTMLYQGPIHGLTNWGWPIALMLLCLAVASKDVTLPVPNSLVLIGELSFSLYLVHGFVHSATHFFLDTSKLGPQINTAGLILTTTALSVMLAHFSHRLLEQGVAESMRKWLLSMLAKRGTASAIAEISNDRGATSL